MRKDVMNKNNVNIKLKFNHPVSFLFWINESIPINRYKPEHPKQKS